MPPSHNQRMAEPGFKHRLFVLNPVLFKPDYIWHIFLKYASPKDLWCPRIVTVDRGVWKLDWLISGCLLWTWHQYTFSLLREKSCNNFFFLNLAIARFKPLCLLLSPFFSWPSLGHFYPFFTYLLTLLLLSSSILSIMFFKCPRLICYAVRHRNSSRTH